MPPKLQPPGTPLPLWQRLFLKWIVKRKIEKRPSEEWLIQFQTLTGKIQKRVMDSPSKETPVLVPPIIGLEDSSRYWSPYQVVEHLNIVQKIMAELIQEISNGKDCTRKLGTAELKPSASPANPLGPYQEFSQVTAPQLWEIFRQSKPGGKALHPWFGWLTINGWMNILIGHASVHYRQLKEMQSAR